jgi:DNA repair protein RecN (Recombination protein N)
LLQHQLQELEDAALAQDELDTIERHFKTSANASSLIEKTTQVLNQLEQESGANTQLLNLSHVLNQALETDEKLTPIAQMLSSAQVQTQETIYELNNYSTLNTLPGIPKTCIASVTKFDNRIYPNFDF